MISKSLMDEYSRKYHKEIEKLEKVILNPVLRKRMKLLFYDYFESIVTTKENLRHYFLTTAIISKFLQAKGKKLLDIGCGFGLRLICHALLGSREAIGIDISELHIEGFQILLRDFPQLNINAQKGDFLHTDFPPSSFDVVFLEESISHIRNTHLLLDKIRKVLRPSGILFIKDCNNALLLNKIRIQKQWKKAEHGPIDERWVKHGPEVEKLCFFEARMKIIQGLYPSLDDGTLKLIARQTQGMYGEEITKATKEFMATGKISQKVPFPYRNPYTGEFPELGFHPFKLIKYLRRLGFRCKIIRPPWVYLGVYTPNVSRWKVSVARMALLILMNCPEFLLPFLSPCFHIMALKER